MERLRKAEALILGLENALTVAILAFLVTVSFLQVLLRQIFGGGLLWGDTLTRHLVLWVGFLGAAAASADEKHFAFEALTTRLPAGLRRGAATAARLTGVAVSGLLAKASWSFLLEERSAGNTLFSAAGISVPAWIFASILPMAFSLVALHIALRIALGSSASQPAAPGSREP